MRLVQPQKAPRPITLSPLRLPDLRGKEPGIYTPTCPLKTSLCSAAHLQKASVPISSTLAGITTSPTTLPQNQWFPILFTPSGTTAHLTLLRAQMPFPDAKESGPTYVVSGTPAR